MVGRAGARWLEAGRGGLLGPYSLGEGGPVPDASTTPAISGSHSLPLAAQPSVTASPQTEEFFDLIASSQSRRLDDQRASIGSLPGLRITLNNVGHLRGDGDPQEPGDEFFNMLIKYQVGLHSEGEWAGRRLGQLSGGSSASCGRHLMARSKLCACCLWPHEGHLRKMQPE